MKLIFTPRFEENDNPPLIVEDEKLGGVMHKLINELVLRYGVECLEYGSIFEGLAALQYGDETEYHHFDFSCPEDAFDIKVIDN
jgi:hypothetical protein